MSRDRRRSGSAADPAHDTVDTFGVNAELVAEIRQRWEIGFTTGATERWKAVKGKVTTPRLGITYRFGQNTKGIRFVIRFRN